MNLNRGGGGDDSVVDDLEAMGAPADVIEVYKQEKAKEDVFPVFQENWQALTLFVSLGTQWKYKAISTDAGIISMPVGLDYTAMESVMRMQGVDKQGDVFEQVRIMELAALEAMAEI